MCADELLMTAQKIVEGLRVNEVAVAKNLREYGTFAATERLLMTLVQRGASRQEMHERIREHAMTAWREITQGHENPLADHLSADEELLRYLSAGEVRALLDSSEHLGDAPERARAFVRRLPVT